MRAYEKMDKKYIQAKKDRIMSKEERKIVSYHEVGHALISALQKNSEPVQKITIVPRTMGALGYVMHVPEEEKYLNTEAELRDMLVGLVGGRAAEEIVFDTVTTGAANDIEKATEIARNMITRFGMSKRFGLVGLATVESKYLDGRSALTCSEQTATGIDEEVVAMLKESYDTALSMLRENRELMDKLAGFLIEKETITGKEFMEIFRREKGIPEPEEKDDKTKDDKTKDDKTGEDVIKAETLPAKKEEAVVEAAGKTVEEVEQTQDTPSSEPEKEESANVTENENARETQQPANVTGNEDAQETQQPAEEKPPYLNNPADVDERPVGRFSNKRLDD